MTLFMKKMHYSHNKIVVSIDIEYDMKVLYDWNIDTARRIRNSV